MRFPSLALAACACVGTPAQAGELFGGIYVHDVKTPLNLSGIEPGVDLQIGYRGGGMFGTRFQPYAFGALNGSGETSYAAAGVSIRYAVGSKFYVRPGVGVAVHTGSADKFEREDRVAFGSRLLFQPEVGIGMDVNDRLSVEASLVHLSHGQFFGGQNPGIDNLGVRLNLKL
jgi:lipid A 3-O-deacylase